MVGNKRFSLLYPAGKDVSFWKIDDSTFHDLGLDVIVRDVSSEPKEQATLADILSCLSSDPDVTNYRQDIFEDLRVLPDVRAKLEELLEKIEFNKQYGVLRKSRDEVEGLWFLMHRLDQYRDYITCVDSLRECLCDERIRSQGLREYRDHIDKVYSDAHFNELRKDLEKLTVETSEIQSVTIGMNLNSRLEATSLGIVSVNNRPFKKSGIVSNFADGIGGDRIREGNDWEGDMHYRLVEKTGGFSFTDTMTDAVKATSPLVRAAGGNTMTSIPGGDGLGNTPAQFDSVLNRMLDTMAKNLRKTLDKYADTALAEVSDVIPEFVYYIRFIDFMAGIEKKGFKLSKAKAVPKDERSMKARGFYNFKLAMNLTGPEDLITNDLDFDDDHTIYILTGANRGGKTTSTQAVGLLFALAQGGVFVPADSFEFVPADRIYTHFPADEDKTMDLGRLGEECIRFKEIFDGATPDSLILMNETFSTTSFEEGYYIACDSVRALLTKGARTIYNTHMHKLATDAEGFSRGLTKKAASLIVRSDSGRRSFKLAIAPPEGSSYASDIAEKYGVTYEMLTGNKK